MTRAVLITGASTRLGAAMAKHLAKQGFYVAVHYNRSQAEAEALVRDLGDNAVAVQGDITDRLVMRELINQAVAKLQFPLTDLINNASQFIFDRVEDGEFESWDANLRTNLEAPFFLSQAFARQCQGEGSIINMIDQRVLRPTPNFASYGIAKSALLTLTKTTAMALAPKIRVNAIGPGTTLQGAHQSKENFEYHRGISILKRGADVEDIIGAAEYLLNARAVTGQMIAVDGGQHLIWELPPA